ncbi:MAG: hypothetical protein ALAOOOJD_00410 [bacterium]|nr:hypothetical protein [bacterium]
MYKVVGKLIALLCMVAIAQSAFAQISAAKTAAAEADKFFQAKDWPNAAKAYETITKKEPQNFLAWNRLGTAYHSAGQYNKAAAAWEQAVALNANANLVKYNLACAYARVNNKDKAFAVLNQVAASGFFQPEQISADADLAGLQDDPRFKAVLAEAQKNGRPCTVAPEYRQFDFWIGEWDVQSNGSGQPAGKSSVQLILGECIIFENWTGISGVNGKSFNLYNAVTKQWQQKWVDDRGTITDYAGGWKDDRMEFLASQLQPDGKTQLLRMTFFKLDPDRVRQFGELSTDEGKTWSTQYDLIYVRKK